MQGTLRELDVASLLRLIELGQRTGELFLENRQGQIYFLFFSDGRLVYATDSHWTLSRLREFLVGWQLDHILLQVPSTKAGAGVLEYAQVWALLESHELDPSQAIALVQAMMLEVLFDVLPLLEGRFVFEQGDALCPPLTSLVVSEHLSPVLRQVQAWKQMSPLLRHTGDRPVLRHPEALAALSPWIDGGHSLRQISRFTQLPFLAVASKVYGALLEGSATVAPYQAPGTTVAKATVPRVLCIDDSNTIRRAVEYILSSSGYAVVTCDHPVRALPLIYDHKPHLVLSDISMPELTGYELCAMLRHTRTFAQTPIIMLTSKDGYLDRVRARMAGATDYLTKPFGERELLMVTGRYLKDVREYPVVPAQGLEL
ncbi:MAG: response regulator [Oscillatoriales cyanobacterium SM2_2_1]|nr:response regulator [Oscillatoriales cyanobacterium SM2_2_1]